MPQNTNEHAYHSNIDGSDDGTRSTRKADEPVLYRTMSTRPVKASEWSQGGREFRGMSQVPNNTTTQRHSSAPSSNHDLEPTSGNSKCSSPVKKDSDGELRHVVSSSMSKALANIHNNLVHEERWLAKKTDFVLSLRYEVLAKHNHDTTNLNQVLRKVHKEMEYFSRPSIYSRKLKDILKGIIFSRTHQPTTQDLDKITELVENLQQCLLDDTNTLKYRMDQCTSWLEDTANNVPANYSKIYLSVLDDLLDYRGCVNKYYKTQSDRLGEFLRQLKSRDFTVDSPSMETSHRSSLRSSMRKSQESLPRSHSSRRRSRR